MTDAARIDQENPLGVDGFARVAAETEPGARGQKLSVTPAGLEKLAAALPLWRTAQTRVSDILGPREAALIALLTELETDV